MVYENIRFHQPHMVVQDGYFYLLDYTQGLLSQKLSNGNTGFQYPINIPNTFTDYTVGGVICLQYDGCSFWSLQKFSDGSGLLIRRWFIDNYICLLKNQFPFINTLNFLKYDASTFCIEHYTTTLYSDAPDGINTIYISEYTEFAVFPGSFIMLGPNKLNQSEFVTVLSVDVLTITLTSPVIYTYLQGDDVNITASIFLFNNYVGYSTSNEGSLLVLSPDTGVLISKNDDIEYKNVTASKFYRLRNVLQDYPDVFTLAYISGTNLKLRDMRDLYGYRADVRGSDSFNALDNSQPDETKWLVKYGNPNILDNKLYLNTDGGGREEIKSSYLLLNNFELQISGSLWGATVYSGTENKGFSHYINLNFPDSALDVSLGLQYSNNFYNSVDSSGLLLKYDFDNTFEDSSGNNYITTSTVFPTFSGGVDLTPLGAARFSSTSFLTIANTTSLEIGKNGADFSVVFWLRMNTTYDSSYHVIFQKGTSATVRTPYVWAAPNTNTIYFGVSTTASNGESVAVTNFPINTWVYVAFIKLNLNIYVYYNAAIVGSANISTTVSNTGPIYLGTTTWYSGKNFDLDYFKLFNRALNAYEIKDYWQKESKAFESLNNSLIIFSKVNNSLINYITLSSGIDDLSYNFKASKISNTLQLSYYTSTSGIPNSSWNLLSSFNIPIQECSLHLGLHSILATVSGSYFEDLVFYDGYLRYPVDSSIYYGTMSVENLKVNQSTILPIYAIDIEGDNLYRLQLGATYYGSDITWSTYNYQVSPIRPFVDFITVDASTNILPATGRNTAIIRSVTYDQYGQGVVNRPVTFTDDDSIGFITRKEVYTDIFYNTGKANTGYTSGTSLRVVKIDALVTQLD